MGRAASITRQDSAESRMRPSRSPAPTAKMAGRLSLATGKRSTARGAGTGHTDGTSIFNRPLLRSAPLRLRGDPSAPAR
ncbi:hypothetical protein chiPu_0020413 [Chiloscyllium punctatum]|uniref:Uncharacterized protein n=1 Tax=Chiloscyllium punctatum TaxID=137246 RepID=A0A401RFD9_CHIPU|nr:hypothetical protein [Chiloscyllium punctatum]